MYLDYSVSDLPGRSVCEAKLCLSPPNDAVAVPWGREARLEQRQFQQTEHYES
jgi:hypothetical protein